MSVLRPQLVYNVRFDAQSLPQARRTDAPGDPLISPGCARQINDFQRNVRTRRSAMLLTYLIFPYEATV